jgi:hypothetical protein
LSSPSRVDPGSTTLGGGGEVEKESVGVSISNGFASAGRFRGDAFFFASASAATSRDAGLGCGGTSRNGGPGTSRDGGPGTSRDAGRELAVCAAMRLARSLHGEVWSHAQRGAGLTVVWPVLEDRFRHELVEAIIVGGRADGHGQRRIAQRRHDLLDAALREASALGDLRRGDAVRPVKASKMRR